MKIVALSDNHTNYDFNVPTGDILIHAGDATFTDKPEELQDFIEWIARQSHTYKLWIPGNHSIACEDFPYNTEVIDKEAKTVCLHNIEYSIDGLKFFGTAYTPEFNNWAFNLTERQSKLFWENAPETDILVSHGPPRGVLDIAEYEGRPLGCPYHLNYLSKVKPKINIFGHIHGGFGHKTLIWDDDSRTECYNVSVLNEQYKLVNKVTELEI